jgi:hypothetical protein
MQAYAKIQAKDRTGETIVGVSVPFPAITTTAVENGATSSVTALNANTTVVEVAAVGAGAAIRWSNQTNLTATSSVFTAAGTAAFDNFIPSGQVRLFVVPRSAQAIGPSSVVGLNIQEGLYSGVAIKSAGVGSVLLTQY